MRTSNDPISDFLTRIRNAQRVDHKSITFPYSKIVHSIAKILEKKGYVISAKIVGEGARKDIEVELKYFNEKPVIRGLQRVSKPGRRVYSSVKNIPRTIEGLGLTLVSTPKGVLTRKEAKEMNVGGEVLCKIW